MTTPSHNPATEPSYTILAALSFDASGEWALLEASRLARHHPGSEVHVVHVVEEDSPAQDGATLGAINQQLTDAPQQMQRTIERLWTDDPRQITAHLRLGVPERSILQTAIDIDADMIVVGAQQANPKEQRGPHSTALGVCRSAHCPVLIAAPKNYAGEVRSEHIEATCPDCLTSRAESSGQRQWCTRHARHYIRRHTYEPSDRRRNALMPNS
jgi:nucleotide-binding universal stress UspA family protein